MKTIYKAWPVTCAFTAASMLLATVGAADRQASSTNATLQFRAQEIATDFGVGYAVVP